MMPEPENANAVEKELPKVEIGGDDDLADEPITLPQCRIDDPDCESCQ
jgi:hypothetical protein